MHQLLEVEKKYKLREKKEVFIKRLEHQGFHRAHIMHESDTYYSRPDIDYMETVECLRIRKRDDFAELTYKPSTTTSSAITAKPETNVALKSPEHAEQARQLFFTMGMVELVKVEKTRSTYKLEDEPSLSVCVDDVKHAGVFLEIEVMAVNETDARKLIDTYETRLGLMDVPIIRLPYRDLVMDSIQETNNA